MSTPEDQDCERSRPGKVGWNELMTSDPAAAIAFYTKLFGWTTEPFPSPEMEYTIFKHDGIPFGGVMAKPAPEVPTYWLNYVSVEDIDASVAESGKLGGTTLMGPMEVPDVGRIAVIQDPQGATIGLHQAPK